MQNQYAPIAFRLFNYWEGLPPGRGVGLREMMDAMDAWDPQTIRACLTKLRQGRVRNPTEQGTLLRPLPVRWNPDDGLYYDLSNMPPSAVAAQVPGNILTGAVTQLLSRVNTLESSMGQDGIVRSAQSLLSDRDIRDLLLQIPLDDIWLVQDRLQAIARARELLELRGAQATRELPEPDEEDIGEVE